MIMQNKYDFDNYKNEFREIDRLIKAKKKRIQSSLDPTCPYCITALFIDDLNSNLVCKYCGYCIEHRGDNISFNQRKFVYFNPKSFIKKNLRHKMKRMNNLIEKMKITDPTVIKNIIKLFKDLICYFKMYQLSANMFRYTFIIMKSLEQQNRLDLFPSDLNFTEKTIEKYSEVWDHFLQIKNSLR